MGAVTAVLAPAFSVVLGHTGSVPSPPLRPGDGPWVGDTGLLWAWRSQDSQRHQTWILGGRHGWGGMCDAHGGRLPTLHRGAVPPTWPALSRGPCVPRRFCGTLMPLQACLGGALGVSSVSEVETQSLRWTRHTESRALLSAGLRELPHRGSYSTQPPAGSPWSQDRMLEPSVCPVDSEADPEASGGCRCRPPAGRQPWACFSHTELKSAPEP